jgi:pilus assembly protein CpaF
MSVYGTLSDNREEQYRSLRKKILNELGTRQEETDRQVREEIFRSVAEAAEAGRLTVRDRVELGKRLYNSLRGLDILQPLLEDPEVTDIMVNGPDHVYVERGGVLEDAHVCFESSARLEDVIQQVVGSVNRKVNENEPIADARLADGSRVNVILPPVALNGPALTLRKFRKIPIQAEELVNWGTMTQEAADFLKSMVENRYNIFVCGGTGAGKTTLLNVLSNYIPPQERIITIEDAAELRLRPENVVTLETREGRISDRNRITMRDLIRTSLRARPDRIIVGEIRGPEAVDMLTAMNTGHDGSLSTGHSNSAQDMISRIETMVLMGVDIPLAAIRQQIASALDIFVYIRRMRDGKRKITQISQVIGADGSGVRLEDLFEMQEDKLVRTTAEIRRKKGIYADQAF